MPDAPAIDHAAPPVAEREPTVTEIHGATLTDDYAWLRDPDYPEVKNPRILAYLEGENEYLDSVMAPQEALRERLYEEMRGRIKEDDSSVPARIDDYFYFMRYREGQQYPAFCRRRDSERAPDEIVIDFNIEAGDGDYFAWGALAVSPDHGLLAYAVDYDGSERYSLRIRDLETGEDLADRVENVSGNHCWAEDGRAILYTALNENQRPDRAAIHRLGESADDDVTIYREEDPGFFVSVHKSRQRRWLYVSTRDKITTEIRVAPAARPDAPLRTVIPRRADHEYHVEDRHDDFYILTNDVSRDFRLVRVDSETALRESDGGASAWVEVVPPSDGVYLTDIDAFEDHVVISEREGGLTRIRVLDARDGVFHRIAFPDDAFTASVGETPGFRTSALRVNYQSMVTPPTVYDYDMVGRALTVRKVREIPGGYDRERYVAERLWITARDGARVPVSVMRRGDVPADGSAPLYLYGYGSYGHAVDPYFSANRLSIVDRGFIFAIGHIRGGDDLGHHWYEDGKLLKKKNTFNDFIDCATGLAARGYGREGEIAIAGGSAGGMLVGACLNMAPPTLFKAAIAQVPFVDVMNTMLDETLPLTPPEFTEWGNPKDPEYFGYMLDYSPYDNVAERDYPHLLITAGVSDPRVTYWEPAKWCAKLRATKTDDKLLLLKTNMSAGHGGASGRFEALRELALEYAFLLRVFGKAD